MSVTIKVTKKNLQEALEDVILGVEGSDENKIQSHVVFRIQDDAVQLLSAGLRVFASAKVHAATFDGDETFTVPAWRLATWLGNIKNPDEEVTVEYNKGVTTLISPRGKGRVGSLDPAAFSWWDTVLDDLEDKATVEASALARALDYSRKFCSDQETKFPQQCAVECRNGVFHSTDRVVVALTEAPGCENLTLRAHSKDISPILAFLGRRTGDDIRVAEYERGQVFLHGDSILGVTRWMYPFPSEIKMNREDTPRLELAVSASALKEAIAYVSTFADKQDKVLHLNVDSGSLVVGTNSAASVGGQDTVVIPLTNTPDTSAFTTDYPNGIRVDRDHLVKILGAYGTKGDVSLGMSWKGARGGTRFRWKSEDDVVDFYSVLLWMK